jgi:hypothetical protein
MKHPLLKSFVTSRLTALLLGSGIGALAASTAGAEIIVTGFTADQGYVQTSGSAPHRRRGRFDRLRHGCSFAGRF